MSYDPNRTTSFDPCHWCKKPTRTVVFAKREGSKYATFLPRCEACKKLGHGDTK